MLNLILFLVALSLRHPGVPGGDTFVEVNSKVDSVVVYPDRVLVSRVAYVNLQDETKLVFSNLPGGLDDQSVRVKAQGVTIGEIQILRGYAKEPHPRVKELEAKIKALEIEDRTLTDETAVMQSKEKLLSSISVGSADVISKEIYTGKVAPAAWQQGVRFVVDELMKTRIRIAEIERAKVTLSEKLDALRRELGDVKAIEENRKAIIFHAQPKTAQSYKLELSYLISGASWRTYYDLRANPSAGQVSISYYSKTSQRTGEDWDEAKIVLSTAKPVFGGAAPTPDPWYITIRQPEYAERKDAEGLMRAAEAAKPLSTPAVLAPAAPPSAPPVEAGISIWYPLPGRYTIKSGDQERKILITNREFDASFDYFIMPRVTQFAYSIGNAKNTSDYLFLAGYGGTYVGDDFTGNTYVSDIAPEESLRLSFGVDERIRIKRETKKMKVNKGGMFGGKTKYEFTYENIIENFHSKEVSCRIVDQVPLPNHPDIKVVDVKLTPKPDEEDKDRGIYSWLTKLGAKAKYTVTVSFTVEAPSDARIDGLAY